MRSVKTPCKWAENAKLFNQSRACTVGQNKTKHPNLFHYKLSYKNETGTDHHGLLSTSVWCLQIFLRGPSTWESQPNFNFFNVSPQIFQRNLKAHLTNCLEHKNIVFYYDVNKSMASGCTMTSIL